MFSLKPSRCLDFTVECGMTVNLAKIIRETEPGTKQGKDELFKRLRASTVAGVIQEKITAMRLAGDFGDLSDEEAEYLRHQKQQIEQFQLPSAPKREYLLLDVREREDYDRCHINGALSYPFTRLSHATNPFTAEILAYRNKDNRAIVIYDLEEELVTQRKIGNIFFEKGVDNIYAISGGLREFVQSYSHLIIGESPVPILPKDPRLQSRIESVQGSVYSASRHHSMATSHKPKSLSSSLARPQGSTSWR